MGAGTNIFWKVNDMAIWSAGEKELPFTSIPQGTPTLFQVLWGLWIPTDIFHTSHILPSTIPSECHGQNANVWISTQNEAVHAYLPSTYTKYNTTHRERPHTDIDHTKS